MKLRLLLTATCLVLPLVAHAQLVSGPYVTAGAGLNILNPVNESSGYYVYPSDPSGNGYENAISKNQFRANLAASAGLGYGFGNGFRVELDVDLGRSTAHRTDISSYNFSFNGPFTVGNFGERSVGIENKYGPMFNLLYDIPVGLPVVPYVGAGVGYQWMSYQSYRNGYYGLIGKTTGSFAYDVIAGIAYPVAAVPGLALTAQYRFMQTVESRNVIATGGTGTGYYRWNVKVGQESSSSFELGLRYQLFNPPPMAPAPAPAPAPVAAAPAPAPARTYLVFFDWNRASLTPRATQIIAQAASDSHTAQTTTLDVSGYTDTSGTPTYNMGLSERRAQAVAGQLVADGVPQSEISIHAYGETHLLVPTGPGVREPQNRRVEIVLQ